MEVKKRKGDFRLVIYNLKTDPITSKTITLADGRSTLEEVERVILKALGVKQ